MTGAVTAQVPARRLAGFYFAYYAVVGALMPFLPLYLQWRGFRPSEIGYALGAMAAVRILAPNLWGWFADRSGRRLLVMRISAIGALVVFALLPGVSQLLALCVVLALFSVFWNASLPQLEALTLAHLRGDMGRYARIRAAGSIGFIAAVMGLGALIDLLGEAVIPGWILVVLAGVLACSLIIHDVPRVVDLAPVSSLWQVLRRREVWLLMLVFILVQISHGPYYTFFSLYMEQNGYNKSAIAALWSLGVFCEVALFLFMPNLWRRASLQRLFLLALAATVIRWVLTVLAPGHLPLLILAQVLHLASFGVVHAVIVKLVHQYFPSRMQGQGQALLSSLGYGLGGSLGALIAGQLWETSGPLSIFVFAAVVSLVALLLALLGWRHTPGESESAP